MLFNFHWIVRSRRLVSHFGSKTILKNLVIKKQALDAFN